MKTTCSLFTALIVLFNSHIGFAYMLGGKDIEKIGTGKRTLGFITAYYASLYVPEVLKGKSELEIIEADEPMSVVLNIDSRIISRKLFIDAIEEGLKKSESCGYSTAGKNELINMFSKDMKINKGDTVYINFVPGTGLIINYIFKKSGESRLLGTTGNINLKKALFAIWIGPKPVQNDLKNRMLGRQ